MWMYRRTNNSTCPTYLGHCCCTAHSCGGSRHLSFIRAMQKRYIVGQICEALTVIPGKAAKVYESDQEIALLNCESREALCTVKLGPTLLWREHQIRNGMNMHEMIMKCASSDQNQCHELCKGWGKSFTTLLSSWHCHASVWVAEVCEAQSKSSSTQYSSILQNLLFIYVYLLSMNHLM